MRHCTLRSSMMIESGGKHWLELRKLEGLLPLVSTEDESIARSLHAERFTRVTNFNAVYVFNSFMCACQKPVIDPSEIAARLTNNTHTLHYALLTQWLIGLKYKPSAHTVRTLNTFWPSSFPGPFLYPAHKALGTRMPSGSLCHAEN